MRRTNDLNEFGFHSQTYPNMARSALIFAVRSSMRRGSVDKVEIALARGLAEFCERTGKVLSECKQTGNESHGRRLGQQCVNVLAGFGLREAISSASRLAWGYGGDWIAEVEYLIDFLATLFVELQELIKNMK